MTRPRRIEYRGAVYRLASSPTLLLTDSDMDGSCCIMAVQEAFPGATIEVSSHDVIEDRAKGLLNDPEGYDRVIFADMLPGDEELVRELHSGFDGDVHAFDHHEHQEYLNELDGCRHDFDACSGLIATQELLGDDHPLHAFAKTVDLWDRMVEDGDGFDDARRLSMLHNFIGQSEFVDRGPIIELDDNEEHILKCLERAEKEQVDHALANMRRFKDSDGNQFVMAIGLNNPLMHSSTNVARAIYHADDRVDYVACWHPSAGSRSGAVSLYSRHGGFNCAEVAKSRGGGGHQGAAGFQPEDDLYKVVAKYLFGKRKTS